MLPKLGALILVFVFAMLPGVGHAEISDREFETSVREQKRDFDRFVRDRKARRERGEERSQALSQKRRIEEAHRLQVEVEYRRTMKRYSMSEVEAKDRADEERLAKASQEYEKTRTSFVKQRDRRMDLVRSIDPIDPYQEFDINMGQEPETKSSYSRELTETN